MTSLSEIRTRLEKLDEKPIWLDSFTICEECEEHKDIQIDISEEIKKAKLALLDEFEPLIVRSISEVKLYYRKHPTAKFSDAMIFGVDEGLARLRDKLLGEKE